MTTPHPAALDTAYGRAAAAPVCRLRFTLGGAQAVTVVPMEGDLTWDAGAWPRTTLRAVLPTTITPTLLPPALSAYGGRVEVTMGARIRGVEHTFRAATLAVAQVDVDRPDARVEVTAVSMESAVDEDRYDYPTNTGPGTVSGVVTDLVRRTLGPTWPVDNQLGALDVIVPDELYELAGDVWPVVERIMDDAGGEAWFRADGTLVLRPVPVVKSTPDLTIRVGGDGGTLTGYSSTRRWGPNRVALAYSTPEGEGSSRRHGWTTSTTTAGAGLVGANAAPNVATLLRINVTDLDGTNVGAQFAGLQGADGLRPADRIRVVDDDPNLAKPTRVVYQVTGTATLAGGVWSIPVQVVRAVKAASTAEWFPNNKVVTITATIRPRRMVGVWEDTNPSSPTRVAGPYGRHTYREDVAVDRGELPTQAEANAAALAMARRVVGRLRGVTVRAVPAPWLLPGDTVRLTMLGGLTESHVVQSVTHPLSGLDVCELTTRDATYTGGPF